MRERKFNAYLRLGALISVRGRFEMARGFFVVGILCMWSLMMALCTASCAQGEVPGDVLDAGEGHGDGGQGDVGEADTGAPEEPADVGELLDAAPTSPDVLDAAAPEADSDGGGLSECVPETCESLDACGEVSDDCGGTLDCGACPEIDKVSIFGGRRRVLQVEQNLRLDAQGVDASGQPVFCDFNWSSVNPTIARVDAGGRVSGVKAGITDIQAECRGKSDRVRVYINDSGLPEDLATPNELGFWLRADVGLSVSSTVQVKEWEDLSGHGRRFFSDEFTEQPKRVLGEVGGEPVVRFSGRQRLGLEGGGPSLAEMTLFFVFKNNDDSHKGQLLAGCAQGAQSQVRLNGTPTELYLFGEGNGLDHLVNLSQSTTDFQLLTIVLGSGRLRVLQDGVQQVSQTLTTQGTWTFSEVGARCTTEFLKGDIAEVMVFQSALADADIQRVQAYLQARYGF